MLCAAIRQTSFHQNVSRENLSSFNDVKVSQYTVDLTAITKTGVKATRRCDLTFILYGAHF